MSEQGDLSPDADGPHFSPSSVSADYRLSLPPSMETQIRKLKVSLEPWRQLVLLANQVLLWENSAYPTALLAGSTLVFALIWFCNAAFVTVLALLGLLLTLLDCLMPAILAALFKPDQWGGDKQRQYEETCTSLIMYKTKAELLSASFLRLRVTNPKIYFSISIVALCLLVWVGGTVDNVLLTYLLTTFCLLMPGMLRHGMLTKLSQTSSRLCNQLVEHAKTRVSAKKAQ
ncbi:ADP-ribosylation factor-like protein 6-interacting protein 1 isoform X1 [Dendroctonus ponderosae]|uniref:RETREG1-3/ARL6IP-like N-terminal reticulon-homology domain-containing protein n=1 Tax=Dendroctonus ponderosae TaxID=77166 RepID=U4UH15_DENPD|nr:ADP-ribosylation factor-like protein 6-interacting protein 1 isoform X1 [Dendroctonus ponderosae]ERL89866.1 hypothetical protein D910_07225 [Dendroctonus ponderosae]KAH1003166.1 hypothetical protein HUJ05_011106 [Dendroctonus ponderosae]